MEELINFQQEAFRIINMPRQLLYNQGMNLPVISNIKLLND